MLIFLLIFLSSSSSSTLYSYRKGDNIAVKVEYNLVSKPEAEVMVRKSKALVDLKPISFAVITESVLMPTATLSAG